MANAINQGRKLHQFFKHPQVEKYITDNLYIFSRGSLIVALTNTKDTQNVSVQNVPWADGTVVCNTFYPTTDCQTIQNGNLHVVLNNGEPKVYVPKTDFQELVFQY